MKCIRFISRRANPCVKVVKPLRSLIATLTIATFASISVGAMNEEIVHEEKYVMDAECKELLEFVKTNAHDPWLLEERLKTLCQLRGVDAGVLQLRACLKEVGITLDAMRNSYNQTVLHVAVWFVHEEVVELLLKASDDPCAFACIKDNRHWTAFQRAAHHGHEDIIIAILQTACDTQQARDLINFGNQTALAIAKNSGKVTAAAILQACLDHELGSDELDDAVQEALGQSQTCIIF